MYLITRVRTLYFLLFSSLFGLCRLLFRVTILLLLSSDTEMELFSIGDVTDFLGVGVSIELIASPAEFEISSMTSDMLGIAAMLSSVPESSGVARLHPE